jgi:hypothetical protein
MDTSDLGLHGAISRKEALARLGPYEVRRRRESGRWLTPWAGIFVEANRASDPVTLASAAAALAGPAAVLGGHTAAHLHGCRSVDPLPVHVVVPYEHPLRTRPGLVVHNGVDLEADRDVRAGLPVLTFDRVLADVLCRSRPTDALAVIDEALRMVDPAERDAYRARIAKRLEERRDPRGTRRGARLLDLATGNAASPAESWFLWRIVDSGFPVPEVNWSLVGSDGIEVYRLDYAWPELRIAIEYNGYAAHAGRESEDEARAEDLRRRGWIVIVVDAGDLAGCGRFEAALDGAFRLRGLDTSKRRLGVLRERRHREPRRSRPRLAG